MEEHLASSPTVQKPCQTAFAHVSITSSLPLENLSLLRVGGVDYTHCDLCGLYWQAESHISQRTDRRS